MVQVRCFRRILTVVVLVVCVLHGAKFLPKAAQKLQIKVSIELFLPIVPLCLQQKGSEHIIVLFYLIY